MPRGSNYRPAAQAELAGWGSSDRLEFRYSADHAQEGSVSSFDVRMFAIRRRPGRRVFEVRWRVAGGDKSRSFITRALADIYRAELIRAARRGREFDAATGEPLAWAASAPTTVTWYQHAVAYAAMKWPHLAAHSRASMAEALATVTPLLTKTTSRRPPARTLRAALYGYALSPPRRSRAPEPATASALAWLERNSLPVSSLSDPQVIGAAQAATPLARRPYDLRHATLSLWLNASGAPAEVAARAGTSVHVLESVYAHCIGGQEDVSSQRIEDALDAGSRTSQEPPPVAASGSPNRRHHGRPVRHMSVNSPRRPARHQPRSRKTRTHHRVTKEHLCRSGEEPARPAHGHGNARTARSGPRIAHKRSAKPLALRARAGDAALRHRL